MDEEKMRLEKMRLERLSANRTLRAINKWFQSNENLTKEQFKLLEEIINWK